MASMAMRLWTAVAFAAVAFAWSLSAASQAFLFQGQPSIVILATVLAQDFTNPTTLNISVPPQAGNFLEGGALVTNCTGSAAAAMLAVWGGSAQAGPGASPAVVMVLPGGLFSNASMTVPFVISAGAPVQCDIYLIGLSQP